MYSLLVDLIHLRLVIKSYYRTVQKVARQKSGKTFIFGSFSQDKKKNPLSHQQKMKYLKQMFPNEMRGNKPVSGLRTAIEVAVYLNSYDNLVMVVGSDRVSEFQKLLDTYNGVDGPRHGMYSFKKIEVVSAGDRDPDAEGVTGMSASKMRQLRRRRHGFLSKGLPAGYDGTELFNDVRKGMGIQREIKSFKPVSEMDNMEWVREQYFQNMIYEIGEWVKDKKTGIVGEVVKRGTNYVTVVQEDFSLHKIWLEDLETTEKKKTKLPEAVDFLKNRNLWEKYRREVL